MAHFQVTITLDTLADETSTEAEAIKEVRGNLLELLLDEDSALCWQVQNMDDGSKKRHVDETGEDFPFPDEAMLTYKMRIANYNRGIAERDAATLPQIKAPK